MANKLYPKAKEALLSGSINLPSATVKAQLVDTGAYTQSDTHEFLSSVPSGSRVATAQTLTGKTVTNGTFDSADPTFSSVPAGSGSASAAEALIVYIDTGTDSTSRLLVYIDNATGLPVSPNGGDINVIWNAAGIFYI